MSPVLPPQGLSALDWARENRKGNTMDWTSLIPSVVGAGLGYLGSKLQSDAAQDAEEARAAALERNADRALAEAQPWGVIGTGGVADFDQDSRTAMMGLSPDLQAIYTGALGRSGLWGDQAMALGANPFAAADAFYNQQQAYWQPKEDQLRTDAETRLMAQGRLGSTGGQRQYQSVEDAILQAQGQRRTESLNQSQQLINTLLGRESADIGQAVGLLNIPLQYGALGRGIGGDLGKAAAYGLESRATGAKALSDIRSASPWGSTLSGLAGLFTTPQAKSVFGGG